MKKNNNKRPMLVIINYGVPNFTITTLQKIECKVSPDQLKLKVHDTYKEMEKEQPN